MTFLRLKQFFIETHIQRPLHYVVYLILLPLRHILISYRLFTNFSYLSVDFGFLRLSRFFCSSISREQK